MKTGSSFRPNRNFRFPGEERLKGREEILKVLGERKGISCSGAKLLRIRNGLEFNRIAFTFPRKYGNAVERNYSRRLSREVYRLLRSDLKPGFDMVLMVFPGGDTFAKRMDQMRELFCRSGLLKPS